MPGCRGVGEFVCRAVVVCLGATMLALSACGGGSSNANPNIIEAGQVNIQLPDGYTLTKPGEQAAAPSSAAGRGRG